MTEIQANRGAHFLHFACQGGRRAPLPPTSYATGYSLLLETKNQLFYKNIFPRKSFFGGKVISVRRPQFESHCPRHVEHAFRKTLTFIQFFIWPSHF